VAAVRWPTGSTTFGTPSSYVVGVTTQPADADHSGSPLDPQMQAMVRAARGPLNWVLVDGDEAARAWSELRDWVEWFRMEFGFDHRVVPPCWYLHPALANVLSALRDHWFGAYDPVGHSGGASDWHRALMQLEYRLREWASRTGCTASAHRDDVAVAYPDDADMWAAHVANDAAARTAIGAPVLPGMRDVL
jgi:hypothetical protein